jgi:hypothetical protein
MPKKIAPPIEMAKVRGTQPPNNAPTPSVRKIFIRRGGKDKTEGEGTGSKGLAPVGIDVCKHEHKAAFRRTFASSMTLVLTTSSGVVIAAAAPPASIPQTAASPGVGLLPPR